VSFASWLRFQLALAVVGAGTWYAGSAVEEPFVSGLGVGIMLAALAVRLVRGREPGDRGGDGA